MTPEHYTNYSPLAVTLRDGRSAWVRPVAPDDLEALMTFYAEIPREDLRFYYPHPMTHEYASRNTERALSPLCVALVLTLPDGRIVGYSSYEWADMGDAYSLFGLCIARECQGVGAGRLLMEHLLTFARQYGPPVMALTVQLANTRAVSLYRSMGFQVMREQMVAHDSSLDFADEPEYYMECNVRDE